MYTNQVQAMLKYVADGWNVMDSGWPDFLLFKEEEGVLKVRMVEEKSGSRSFSTQQKSMLLLLERMGLDVFIIVEGNTQREFPPSAYFRLEEAQALGTGLSSNTIRNYRVKLRLEEAKLADLEPFDPVYDLTLARVDKLRRALGMHESELGVHSPFVPGTAEYTAREKRLQERAAESKKRFEDERKVVERDKGKPTGS